MNKETHKQLLDHYLLLGGNPQKIKPISSFSMSNHAKLKYFIKQLNNSLPVDSGQIDHPIPEEKEQPASVTVEAKKERKSIFSDLISLYPQELHTAFKKRYEYWLEACSLKIQLNNVEIQDEETAYSIQVRLFDALDKLDKCQKALDHYKEFKRVLSIETKVDFSTLSPMELIKARNNLRTNITKRKATISKMESELPKHDHPNYKRDLHLLNRKKEQLQEYINQVESLNQLINE